jgi:transposase-like protein
LKTAVWLDGQGRQWDYEREALRLSDGRHYTPDFWIVDEDGSERLLEVKGAYFAASKARIDLFRKDRPDVVLDVWREPELRARGILDIPLPDFVVKPLRSTRRIPPELRRQVIALYSAGCSLGEIKATTGVGASVVCNTIKAAGVAMPRSERRRLASASRAVRDRVADLYADGRSIAVVARTLGLSKDVVYGEIKRRGIVRPRPGAA